VKYKWTPKAKSSTGSLTLNLTEASEAALSGAVSSGSFSPLTFSGQAKESFTGGANCGKAEGKKKPKPVKKATFSGAGVAYE